ncbi:MFS transporter small subunit [Streptomyces sp. NPDC001704]
MTVRKRALFAVAWLWVGVPFAYGMYELGLKLKQLLTSS